MKYYEMKKDNAVYDTLQSIKGVKYNPRMSQEEFDKTQNLLVDYFKYSQFTQYSDMLPNLLISDIVKAVFEIYDDQIKYKYVQFFSEKEGDDIRFLYVWPYASFIDCLSNQTEKYTTGMLKKLVLSRNKINEKHIFYINDILENKLIVSQAVAESLLRRGILGIIFHEISIEE